MSFTVIMVKGTRIELPSRDKYGDGQLTVDDGVVEIRMRCCYTRRVEKLGVLVIKEGAAGRQIQDGPKVPGPWGGSFALATVISDCPDKPPVLRILAVEGGVLVIGGQAYEIVDDRPSDYPRLVAVS